MNKAHVRAPALVARDLPRFLLTRFTFPEHLEVHPDGPKVANRLAQLTSAHTAIEIDYSGGLSRRTRHRPTRPACQVLKLDSMMEGQRSNVCCFLDPSYQSIPVVEHSLRIAPLNLRQSGIDLPQLLALEVLEAGILHIAPNQIEIMPVDQSFGTNQLRERKDFVKVVPGDHGVDVHDQTASKCRLQFPQHPRALQRFLKI